MKYQVGLSDEARLCIDEQTDWYRSEDRHGGDELALRWLEKIYPVLSSLEEMPSRHGLAPENGRWHPGLVLRQLLFRPWRKNVGWRILYTIDEGEKLVTVLQIRHEHRRWLYEASDADEV